jgi:hypothetical protein
MDPEHSNVRVRSPASPEGLAGRVVTFGNSIARTAHQIKSAHRDGEDLVLELRDDLLSGLLHVSSISGSRINTKTRLVFAASYLGATVLDSDYKPVGRVNTADQDHLELAAAPSGETSLVGTNVWIASVGPGDVLTVPAVFTWQR